MPSSSAPAFDPGTAEQRWQLMHRFVLRSPGFPFSWLAELRFPRSIVLARQIIEAQERRARLWQAFDGTLFPALLETATAADSDKVTFRFWYHLARQVRRLQPLDAAMLERSAALAHPAPLDSWLHDWQQVCHGLSQLHHNGAATFAAEMAERRARLRDLVHEPRFQEALWLSNPAIAEVGCPYFERHWQAERRPAKIKHLERRFYSYLQRFCAKNDTASFFGPLNYGCFDAAEQTSVRRVDRPLQARRVFFAYWAAEKLAAQIADDPTIQPYLRPQRDTLRHPPRDEASALYRLTDGQRSVLEIAATLGRPLDAVLHEVQALVASRQLRLDLRIPPATLQPLSYLIAAITALPSMWPARGKWLAALQRFADACDEFASADLAKRQAVLAEVEQHYASLTASEARRGQGQMFQDRVLLYEECHGDITELRLSDSRYREISAGLVSIARLAASYSQLLLDAQRAAAHVLYADLSPDGAPIAFTRFLSAWHRRPPTPPDALAADDFERRLTALVAAHTDGRVCRLRAADLETLCTPLVEPIVLSPDLLIAAADLEALATGDYQLVLGEIHHGVQPSGWMLSFVDQPDAWDAALAGMLPQPSATATPANLIFGRRMKTAPPEFPGPSVEVSGVSARPDVLALNQLRVAQIDDELRLLSPDSTALRFYPPSYGVPATLYAPFACFSYPLVQRIAVETDAHTPRIEIDGVVYQRERWDIPASAAPREPFAGTPFELLIAGCAFQRQFELPDQVFVRTSGEPKPIYIDFTSFFALELLAHLASQTETLTFTDMCPAADQLWLRDADGSYCCEIRTVLSMTPRWQAEGQELL